MKARVKSTGEIVEVDIYTITKRGKMFGANRKNARCFL